MLTFVQQFKYLLTSKFSWRNRALKALLRALARAKKASVDVAGAVIGFGIAAIALLVIVLIFYNIEIALPTTNLSAAGQTRISAVVSTAGSGWSLLTISLIVLAAVVILGVIMVLRR